MPPNEGGPLGGAGGPEGGPGDQRGHRGLTKILPYGSGPVMVLDVREMKEGLVYSDAVKFSSLSTLTSESESEARFVRFG